MLKCTGYAEGTTAIHARNSVRVAQTTAISPAAPAHRTAWNVTWYRGATSSNPRGKAKLRDLDTVEEPENPETEKGRTQTSAVVKQPTWERII